MACVSQQALDDAQQKYLAALNIRDKAVAQIAVDTARSSIRRSHRCSRRRHR